MRELKEGDRGKWVGWMKEAMKELRWKEREIMQLVVLINSLFKDTCLKSFKNQSIFYFCEFLLLFVAILWILNCEICMRINKFRINE